jgi:hypothetical protein
VFEAMMPNIVVPEQLGHPDEGLSQYHGCASENVVTPHASFIALDVAPQQAYAKHAPTCQWRQCHYDGCGTRRLRGAHRAAGVPGQDGRRGSAAGLARPAGLRAVAGKGHVTLDWDPVPGAAGYLVYRAAGEPYQPLDHGGGDVLAVPAGPYADTSGEPGRVRHYALAAVTDGSSAGPLSEPVAMAPEAATGGRPVVTIEVAGATGPGSPTAGELERPWEPMIGSEHLSYMLSRDRTGGRVIGPEMREALRIAHDELGVRAVRAHAILCDDLGVYTESGGRARTSSRPGSGSAMAPRGRRGSSGRRWPR